jgi:hypothetical protein
VRGVGPFEGRLIYRFGFNVDGTIRYVEAAYKVHKKDRIIVVSGFRPLALNGCSPLRSLPSCQYAETPPQAQARGFQRGRVPRRARGDPWASRRTCGCASRVDRPHRRRDCPSQNPLVHSRLPYVLAPVGLCPSAPLRRAQPAVSRYTLPGVRRPVGCMRGLGSPRPEPRGAAHVQRM